MNLPYTWLNEYLTQKLDVQLVADKFTHIGHMLDGQIQDVEEDQVMDLEVRQNRFDCLSIVGLARELTAVTEADLVFPETSELPKITTDNDFTLKIEDPETCLRFSGLKIKDLQVVESPDWLQNRLVSYGIKPINNAVDLTNFVMVELGEPMHAYDLDKIQGKALTARSAQSGEPITVLGGKQVNLTQSDLVISDESGPVALAGIIGGESTAVSDQTTNVLIEAATFNQASIRRTSTRHQLRTEASTRHEKFNHPALTHIALSRFLYLLRLIQPQAEVETCYDNYPNPLEKHEINLRLSALKRLGGVELKIDQVSSILTSLEFEVSQNDEHSLHIKVPYFRTDVEQEEDLIEEVLRIRGYDQIEAILPPFAPPRQLNNNLDDLEEKARDLMVAQGFDEQITEPLVDEDRSELDPVKLENSLSSEKVMLRTTLNHQLQNAVVIRQKHRQEDIRVFEVGKVYWQEDSDYLEKSVLGFVIKNETVSYRDAKGVVENLFAQLEYEISSELYTIKNIEGAYYVQLDLASIIDQATSSNLKVVTSVPQLIFQDYSFLVPKHAKVGEVIQAISRTDSLVYSVELGEDPIDKDDSKSVFLKVAFGGGDKPISNDQVEPIREKIISRLEKDFQAEFK